MTEPYADKPKLRRHFDAGAVAKKAWLDDPEGSEWKKVVEATKPKFGDELHAFNRGWASVNDEAYLHHKGK
jgi:hypothetical protein